MSDDCDSDGIVVHLAMLHSMLISHGCMLDKRFCPCFGKQSHFVSCIYQLVCWCM